VRLLHPIPGQENRNSDFLLENGAAIKINNVATLSHKLKALLNDSQRLRTMKTSAKALPDRGLHLM
jgi:processive 1,2-diacylglycerol beta-glucosyltransferase